MRYELHLREATATAALRLDRFTGEDLGDVKESYVICPSALFGAGGALGKCVVINPRDPKLIDPG